VTCRTRKIKCDERRPLCGKCAQADFRCEWHKPGTSISHTGRRLRRVDQSSRAVNPTVTVLPRPDSRDPESSESPQATQSTQSTRYQSEGQPTPHARDMTIFDDSEPQIWSNVALQKNISRLSPGTELSASHIPLQNSLVLDQEDLECFRYIPDSILVLQFGKPWRWSMLNYIHSEIACRHKGVMRAFIAVASMELGRRGSERLDKSSTQMISVKRTASAQKHYHCALKDLSLLLHQFTQSRPDDKDLEALFALWLLILQFGLYDSNLVGASHIHLSGIHSFLVRYSRSLGKRGIYNLTPASKQLLLFIAFVFGCIISPRGRADGRLQIP